MLKTRIKASRITNLTDARYFAAWEVSWLGFCLDPNAADFIPPMNVKAIKEWVEGPVIIGEFGNQPSTEIVTSIESLGLKGLQLASTTQVQSLSHEVQVPILLNLAVDQLTQLGDIAAICQEHAEQVEVFILQFAEDNILEQLQQNELARTQLIELCHTHNILLDITIAPNQVETLLAEIQPYGLNVTGGAEEKVGYKSFDELDDLFESIEINF